MGLAEKLHEGHAADVFTDTNRIDNMPVAIVEACAMGLPVVATAVGGVPDLLKDGQTGLLVPDEDDEMMVAAIKRLLNDPESGGTIVSQWKALAGRSAWEQVRPQWAQSVADLLARRSTRKD